MADAGPFVVQLSWQQHVYITPEYMLSHMHHVCPNTDAVCFEYGPVTLNAGLLHLLPMNCIFLHATVLKQKPPMQAFSHRRSPTYFLGLQP